MIVRYLYPQGLPEAAYYTVWLGGLTVSGAPYERQHPSFRGVGLSEVERLIAVLDPVDAMRVEAVRARLYWYAGALAFGSKRTAALFMKADEMFTHRAQIFRQYEARSADEIADDYERTREYEERIKRG